jgi:hypothetical protein
MHLFMTEEIWALTRDAKNVGGTGLENEPMSTGRRPQEGRPPPLYRKLQHAHHHHLLL